MFYLTETDPRGAMGLGGQPRRRSAARRQYLAAIDYKTGKIAWRHQYPGVTGSGGNGVLSTAGGLVFAGDIGGNIVAYNARDGKDPVARPHRARVQRAADLHDRRAPARARRRPATPSSPLR